MEYPPAWMESAAGLIGTHRLEIHGRQVRAAIDRPQLHQVFLPLLAELVGEQQTLGRRITVGLAGIPGSGKSTFSALLQIVGQKVLPPSCLAVFGLDGWHYPNVELDRRMTRDAEGRPVPLRTRKGGPESFDVDALAAALDALRAGEGDVLLPVYDRRIHDPRPAALLVEAGAGILLIEGNYLLLGEEPWRRIGDRLDLLLLLTCDLQTARQRVIDRHVQGGCTPAQAEEKYRTNDAPNTRLVLASVARADLVVQPDYPRLCRALDEA